MKTIRVWDLPTRLFHWALVVCVVGLVVTGNVGGEAMKWHFRLGYAVLTLVVFRLIWGFVGGYWSRFSSFLVWPATAIGYARGKRSPEQGVGHNPLGAYSVVALLMVLAIQAVGGLMADDEIMWSGPLAAKVPSEWVRLATLVHTEISKLVLIALVLLHVAAILWYRFRKKENLVKPMLLGDKELDIDVPESRDGFSNRVLAVAILCLSAGFIYALLAWAGA